MRAATVGVGLLLAVGCNKESSEAAGVPGGKAKAAGGPTTAAKGPGGAPGGGPPGGRMPTVLGPADVLVVKPGSIEAAIVLSGDLKPIEEIAVRSRMEGDVVQVLVREGDRVTRGQPIVRFESTVQQGDRASASADVEAAKADVTNAQWNADQSAELFKAGAIPERDLRTTQQTLAASQARLTATEARLRGVARVLADTRIDAPTTGVVSARNVEPGEHVTRGATLVTVVRNDVLELEANVPSRQAAELKPGQTVRFNAAGLALEGRVSRISPTINPANRTLAVYLQVPNRDGRLRGNTFATGRVVTRAISNTIVLPINAVRQSANGEQRFVYRIVEDKVDVATVELGVTDEQVGTQQILSGLAEGDRVIVGNLGALGRGMPVRVVSAEAGAGRGGPAAREVGGTSSSRGATPQQGRSPSGRDSTAKR